MRRLIAGIFALSLFLYTGREVMAEKDPCSRLVAVEESDIDPESWFSVAPIGEDVFKRIEGKSYRKGCRVPLDQLRYVTIAHYDFDGNVVKGEIICNESIAEDLLEIFHNLYETGYPIESVRLIDEFDADDIKSMQANNTSCFNYREIAGSTKLSKHALGLAIDINPLYNPYVKVKNGRTIVSPEEGRPYIDRSKDLPHKIDAADPALREFKSKGFTWGGDWKSLKDYQHFEK